MNCRFCDSPLSMVFADLGEAPPSNSFISKNQLALPENKFPLKLYVCEKCFLVQIAEYKKANEIFSGDYIYFSSYSTSWLKHARDYSEMVVERFGINEQALVVEIASNDGYLLQYFKERNIRVLGIEPTLSTIEVARKKGIECVHEFFGTKLARDLVSKGHSADLLIGNNVLAHVPDINDFVSGLKILLKERGIITMEFPHLYQLIKDCQFDTIYHEHFSYFSFFTVKAIFAKHGLKIFDVNELPTHGGSLRIYAAHSENSSLEPTAKTLQLLEKESQAGMMSASYYTGFQQKIETIKNDFTAFIKVQKAANKNVAAYGAAAKGNTLLNYCGVTEEDVSFVVDASPYKQGKYMPGSHVPVVSEAAIVKQHPDFIILLPWNIKEEIMQQLHYVQEWKCKFVIAIPSLKIL